MSIHQPCYCTIQIFAAHFGFLEWKQISADFFLLFVDIYTVIVNASIKRGWGWDPINWFNTATFSLPVPSQD
jgi:hypothetical protein